MQNKEDGENLEVLDLNVQQMPFDNSVNNCVLLCLSVIIVALASAQIHIERGILDKICTAE